MTLATYLHEYQEGTVYSQVVRLVSDFGAREGVHLDLGCGYAAIAEPLRQLGLEYIGFDVDPAALKGIELRGFEARQIDFLHLDDAIAIIKSALGERRLVSISVIDTLEHVTNGPALLQALHDLANDRGVLLVVSVPNGAHRDLGVKLLTGHWDYTLAGLLDHTHVIHHTDRLLSRVMRSTGWLEVGRRDFHLPTSDQAFPIAHPLLTGNTPASRLLRQIREGADEFSTVNQLVRAYLPGASQDVSLLVDSHEERPFLSIITRTQGKRLGNLRDLLLCLSGQTYQNFEVLVIAHKPDEAAHFAVKRIVEDQPESMRAKTRVIECARGNRTAPLNDGFAAARGHYISILDDDELVFAHWVETFKKLGEKAPGCVLRTTIAEQDVVSTGIRPDGAGEYRSISAIKKSFPSSYDFIAHLSQNFSPTLSLAFPRVGFQDMGIRFDETLDTAEDWDFEMRMVFLCGVEASPEVTGIYRKWRSGESSFSIHSQEEWSRDYEKIRVKHDSQYNIFPPGTISTIVNQQNWIRKLERDIAELQGGRSVGFLRRFFTRHPTLYRIARKGYDTSRIVGRRVARRFG